MYGVAIQPVIRAGGSRFLKCASRQTALLVENPWQIEDRLIPVIRTKCNYELQQGLKVAACITNSAGVNCCPSDRVLATKFVNSYQLYTIVSCHLASCLETLAR